MCRKGLAGRSFYIDFPENSLNTTVFVNGVYCGFEKNPFCHFQIDVTKGIRPGQTNEIWVGIRDAWYGRTADPDRPLKLRRTFNLPLKFFHDGFQDLDYPIWNSPQSGILCTPTFVAAGSVYASDVFVKPLVDAKALEADVTLTNSTDRNISGQVRWEAINDQTGLVEKTFASQSFTLPGGKTQTVTLSRWLGKPDALVARCAPSLPAPHCRYGQRAGRRYEGDHLRLPSVEDRRTPVHPQRHRLAPLGRPDRQHRIDRRELRQGLSPGQRSPDSIRNGRAGWGQDPVVRHGAAGRIGFHGSKRLVVRRNCSPRRRDESARTSRESDPEIRKKQGGSEMKVTLMENWRDQCVAQVKGERNHPSHPDLVDRERVRLHQPDQPAGQPSPDGRVRNSDHQMSRRRHGRRSDA